LADLNGEYGTYELGTVTNAAEFAWLNTYSPLQHVGPGTTYPAVLLITAENDPRVASWQSSKFAATLQKANTSPRPIGVYDFVDQTGQPIRGNST
jgi:prolyl oligopeptidase